MGKTFTWEGRRLKSVTSGENTLDFAYNHEGMRTKKGNVRYFYVGNRLVSEVRDNVAILYRYGVKGLSSIVVKKGEDTQKYVCRTNIFGDVIAIYNTEGDLQCKYNYDAWGNHRIGNARNELIYDSATGVIALGYENHIAILNPIRYRGYYYDTETRLYYLQSRYYDATLCRFLNRDNVNYLEPESINGLNLYCYCHNNPIMYVDPNGHMPKWVQWVVGGLAIAGLVVATVLTCGAAGAGAAAVGAAMLVGGLVSAGINVVDQLSDGGEFDWTELAISTLSGTAYGLVVGLTGGAGGWAVAGKFAVAGGTSLLNSWNQNATFGETMKSLGISLLVSGAAQGAGYLAGKFGPQLLSKIAPRNPNYLLTMGDIGSALWAIPAVKTGVIRFVGGVTGSIFNNF